MGDRVVCTIEGGVADVRLDRPEKLNALDADMFAALARVGSALHDEPGLRAVVLHGAGRSFCAGVDSGAFRAMADGADVLPAGLAAERAAMTAIMGSDNQREAVRAALDHANRTSGRRREPASAAGERR